MSKKPASKSNLKPEEFMVWLTLPRDRRPALRGAAGSLDMTMSDFARQAVESAIRRVEAGQEPFPEIPRTSP